MMNKFYRNGILLICLLFGCAGGVPTTRVHSAASIPRYVDVNNRAFSEEEKVKDMVGGFVGAGYGLAWADSGAAHGSRTYHFGMKIHHRRFSLGVMPYFAQAQVSHEGTGVFGYTLWLALYFGGGSRWRFSYQNTITTVNKTNEVTGCRNGNVLDFQDRCTGRPTFSARSESRVQDIGFTLTGERKLSNGNSLIIAPAAYWTWVSASNQLDVDSTGDFARRDSFWSPGFSLGYKIAMGELHEQALVFLLGGTLVKTFEPRHVVRELKPTADIRYQF